jgi:protein TonB
MAFAHLPPLLPGTPQVLPLQDRALTWACSACFHALALAAASLTSVALREPPKDPPVLSRIEIRLSKTQSAAEQSAATVSPAEADPPTPHETAALAEDTLPVVPAPSSSNVNRTAQPVTTKTPPPHSLDRPTQTRDQLSAEQYSQTDYLDNPSAADVTPTPPAPLNPAESVDYAEFAAAVHSPPEPPATNIDNHVESSPQPETTSPPSTDALSTSGSQTGAVDSLTAPPADTIAMTHPVVTQSISASSRYAWLMDLLRRRIVSLQAYPHLARMQGWEGVVVVKTTINSNGDLVDAVVTKSSGYGALDEDAIRLMHRVCPVHLTHDLGKSKIAVMVPIRYRLTGFEQ